MELRGEYRVDTTIKMTPKHIATLARPAPRVYILSGIVFAGGFLCRPARPARLRLAARRGRQHAAWQRRRQLQPAQSQILLVRQQRNGSIQLESYLYTL